MRPFLSGRVAIVTGASRGLGASTARLLARAGAAVVATARDGEALEKVAAGIRADGGDAIVLPAELSDDDAVQDMIAQAKGAMGRIDFVLSIGGSADGIGKGLASVSADEWARLWGANVTGPLNLIRHSVPVMQSQGGGRLLFLSSSATFRPRADTGAYGATKSAINHFVQSLSAELASQGISACAFNPGPIDTPVFARVAEALWPGRANVGRRPPETAALLLLWLCAPETEGLTGEFVQWDSPNTVAAMQSFLDSHQIG